MEIREEDKAYGTSKCALVALTNIHARQFLNDSRENIIINSCCPGWCRTDMAGPNAPRSATDGADTPVWLSLLPPGTKEPHGEFLRDRKIIKW